MPGMLYKPGAAGPAGEPGEAGSSAPSHAKMMGLLGSNIPPEVTNPSSGASLISGNQYFARFPIIPGLLTHVGHGYGGNLNTPTYAKFAVYNQDRVRIGETANLAQAAFPSSGSYLKHALVAREGYSLDVDLDWVILSWLFVATGMPIFGVKTVESAYVNQVLAGAVGTIATTRFGSVATGQSALPDTLPSAPASLSNNAFYVNLHGTPN